METPTISIVTPSFNAAAYLEDAILSVSRQGRVAVEHIVTDAVSTDGTLEILRQYPHLRWISEPDRGQSDAINKGFLLAKGELVGWLNADDYYLPGALEAIANAAAAHPEADVIYGDCVSSMATDAWSVRRSNTSSTPMCCSTSAATSRRPRRSSAVA
jgi:glycosyltransferase involved in cell wall biosynthesis